jgi:serine/threonine protein kinase
LNDIGKGSFGAVYKILDKNKRIFEAMKRMPNKVEDYKLKYVEILHEL